jgi:hypothetical protein
LRWIWLHLHKRDNIFNVCWIRSSICIRHNLPPRLFLQRCLRFSMPSICAILLITLHRRWPRCTGTHSYFIAAGSSYWQTVIVHQAVMLSRLSLRLSAHLQKYDIEIICL